MRNGPAARSVSVAPLLLTLLAADAGVCTDAPPTREDLALARAGRLPGGTQRAPLGPCHVLETRSRADGGVDFWAVYDRSGRLELFVMPRPGPDAEQQAERILLSAGTPLPNADFAGAYVAASFRTTPDGQLVRVSADVSCPLPPSQ